MDRSQKEKAVEDFKKIFEDAEAVIVAQYKGLNSETIDDLRAKTRDSNVSFKVTKNRLIKIALSGGVYENISDLFSGPTAIAYSKDVVAAAKVTNEFSKNNENLVIIGGALKEKVLDIDGIKHLASLPSLPELQAKILGLISTPARQIATVVATPATQLITVTKAYQGAK
jgi:large subunit ribosomal protein L10|tara:strand:- start:153 stop:662 length:510 start_codon:yes stop_codon:yes gene_type:complete